MPTTGLDRCQAVFLTKHYPVKGLIRSLKLTKTGATHTVDPYSREPHISVGRSQHRGRGQIGSDVQRMIVAHPENPAGIREQVEAAGWSLTNCRDWGFGQTGNFYKPVTVPMIESFPGSYPDNTCRIFKQREYEIARQAGSHGVTANLPIPHACNALVVRGEPNGTVTCGKDTGHNVAGQTLRLGELCEGAIAKAEGASAPRSNPEVAARIFRSSKH